jgi:hypothetical protein
MAKQKIAIAAVGRVGRRQKRRSAARKYKTVAFAPWQLANKI